MSQPGQERARSDSNCDIAIGDDIGVEIKRDPRVSEHDRCFGQIARHLITFQRVAVLMFDVPRQEQFDDFCKLVDKYFQNNVRVIRNP